MADARYIQIEEGKWYRVTRLGDREQCCDCGLVHIIDYRIRETPAGLRILQVRCARDERATAAARSRRGIKVIQRRRSGLKT